MTEPESVLSDDRDLTLAELDAIDPPAHRVPPHNLPAEEALLGAMLISRQARTVGLAVLDGGEFYLPRHCHIWSAIDALTAEELPVDSVTVADEMRKSGHSYDTDKAVTDSLLDTLQATCPLTGNAASYAQIIRRDAHHRRLLAACDALSDAIYIRDDTAVERCQHTLIALIADQP